MVARLLIIAILASCLTACMGSAPATTVATVTSPAASGTARPTLATPIPVTPTSAPSSAYPTLPLPAGCDEAAIRGVVRDFFDAFNRGDQAALARVFPARGTDGDHPWTGDPDQLRWFTLVRANPDKGVDVLNLYTPDTLLNYFAERHAQHERITLIELVVNPAGGGPTLAAINFRIARSADDLPEESFPGKGGVGCAHGTIFLWSQGGAPLARPTTSPPSR